MRREVKLEGNKQVFGSNNSDAPPRLYRIKRIGPHTTHSSQQTHIPSVHNYDTSRHNYTPMIHALFPFPMHSVLYVSHLYVFHSSLWLTWLTNPALMTSVYPNWMQYTPRVLQEASLLDGVDAGVHGNGRRFCKTSSYPPYHCYAFNSFYPYLLMMSLSALFLLIHSFSRPTLPCLPYKSFSHSLLPLSFVIPLILPG